MCEFLILEFRSMNIIISWIQTPAFKMLELYTG